MKKVNISSLDIIGGVTTGQSISHDFYDENSIDLTYEKHIKEEHVQCVECYFSATREIYDSLFKEYNGTCPLCDDKLTELEIIPGEDAENHDDMDGDCSETFLYGSWKKDDEGKFGQDESGEYAAIYDSNDNHIQVVWSKFALKCYHCSPCYPNQGYLDAAGENWTYCLPVELMNDEWREEFEKHMVERYIK